MGDLADIQQAVFDEGNWQKALLRNDKGQLLSCQFNVLELLENDSEWRGVLAFNEFTATPIKCGPAGGQTVPYKHFAEGAWTDVDTTMTTAWLERRHGMMKAGLYVLPAMDAVARMHSFHPIRDWLKGLKWDGEPRVDLLLSRYFGADDTRYSRLVGRKFLVAAVARIMQPGVKVDNVLILEGAQGIRKSTGLKVLAGEQYFSDQRLHLKGDKDSLQALSGKWIFELAELDAFNKAESTEAKAFFAASSDRFRAPYGKLPREVPRQCVFAGTTNQDEYFKDQSGNRRYWPVFCRDVHIAELEAARDQLWAEAVFLFERGVPFWVLDDECAMFEAEQAKREISDPWAVLIGAWLEGKMEVTAAQILIDCLKIDPGRIDDRGMTTRVGRCVKQVGGWRKVEVGRAGCRFVYRREMAWVRPDSPL